jgi:O-antigen/teichoic acid export membrane protein
MSALSNIIYKINSKLSSQFVRNLGWLGTAEIVSRIFRLGLTTVILPRLLTKYDYGLAAIVLTVHEFTRIFIEVGVSTKIIQSKEDELSDLCNSGYWLNWIVFPGLFIVQCIVAFPVSWFYHDSHLVLPICVVAMSYLTLPIGTTQYALIVRENKLKICAIVNTFKYITAYVLSAIFALSGMGVWAFVLPWVFVTPIEMLIYRLIHPWHPPNSLTTKYWKDILNFGKSILGVQLLKTLRNNLDYLIVGRFLGVEVLGIYFFGFNAGLGVSLSIISAINTATLPHLCASHTSLHELKRSYFSVIKTISIIIIPLVFLQSTLAHLYLPLLQGNKWIVAIPILVLICLSAIPRPFADAASQLLVTIGKPDLDLRWNILFTAMFTIAVFIGVHWNAIGVATSVLLVHIIFLPLFTLWATRYVFRRMTT